MSGRQTGTGTRSPRTSRVRLAATAPRRVPAGVRPASAERITSQQAAIIGANIRALRRERGWSQGRLGELVGWPTPATVCAAEGRRVSTPFEN
jgi:hypothetical protein